MESAARPPIDGVPPEAGPAGWKDALGRGKAQMEAGQTVPLEPFLDRLRASIARMRARRDRQDRPAARKA